MNKDALKVLGPLHPGVPLIQSYLEFARALAWIKNHLNYVTEANPRIQFCLNPLGAATGRFTCDAEPLQAVPTELRDLFVADPGHLVIEADFSQIELRVLTHFSQDPSFLAAYCGDGIDLHRRTAAVALGIPEQVVSEAQRNSIGKTVNFGIVYGMTAVGLAHRLRVSLADAQQFLGGFRGAYPTLFDWIDGARAQALQCQTATTLYGRRRHLPDLWSANPRDQEASLRQVVNTIIQGTAADLNKLALIRLDESLPSDCRMLITMHDSVLIEAPERSALAVADQIRTVMVTPPLQFSIPLQVLDDLARRVNLGRIGRRQQDKVSGVYAEVETRSSVF